MATGSYEYGIYQPKPYEYNSSYGLILRAVAEERNTNISLIISMLNLGISVLALAKAFTIMRILNNLANSQDLLLRVCSFW
jgi:hypothetical protein